MATQHHLRDQIRAFLPLNKHALFRAQIVVHDVINIPLVSGAFAFKWRIQNSHSVPLGQTSGDDATKGKAPAESSGGTIEDGSDVSSPATSSSGASSSANAFDYSSGPYGNTSSYGQYLTPDLASEPASTSAEESLDIPDEYISSSKGRTPYLPLLHNHGVVFNHRVDVEVDMSIDKDSGLLQDCELRLDVLQDLETMEKDHDRRSFGVVCINLAEYARAGLVTRRHLLRKSKANAILKVTVMLNQIGGETEYRVCVCLIPVVRQLSDLCSSPELQKGQIMSGVAALMAREGLLHRG